MKFPSLPALSRKTLRDRVATLLLCAGVVPGMLFLATVVSTSVMAHDDDDLSVIPIEGNVTFTPYLTNNPVIHGKVGPLIVMHAMSVHNTLTWKSNVDDAPKVLMFHRHAAYKADEVANPDIINFLILNTNPGPGALTGTTALGHTANQFNSAFRRSFNKLCYGGYNIIHDVSQSVPTRIRVDQTIELTQLWDTGHPDAYNYATNNPKVHVAQLNNSDAEMNFAAWKDMGYSRGLFYDMYCPGFATLEDGRPIFPGGHDMNSQNGLYRIQRFDPDTEMWADRKVSCMRLQYNADPNDPYSEKYFQSQIDLGKAENEIFFPIGNSLSGDCNPHDLSPDDYSLNYPRLRLMGENGTVTHPGRLPSDMRYARWYPCTIALPGNKAFIFGGWDRDETAVPPVGTPTGTTMALANFFASTNYNLPANWRLSGYLPSSGTPATKVVAPAPDVYDGTTDSTITLENARLFHPAWYPNGLVVQTGPNAADWQVLVNSGRLYEEIAEDEGEASPSAERLARGTFLVDVQGATADPERETPNVRAGKWIKLIDTAANTHAPFSANANLMELDTEGKVVSHKLYHFGGRIGTGTTVTDTGEVLDLTSFSQVRLPGAPPIPMPKWQMIPGKLYQRARQCYATCLPDGKILIMGGNGGTLGGVENWSLHCQMFDPATGQITRMDKTYIPRDEHGIIQLYPDATVYFGGQNRNGISTSGNPFSPGGDPDVGVNCAQFYSPPYLFDANTNASVRPVITSAPRTIDYGVDFNVGVDNAADIASVVLIRTGSMSHSLNTDLRYVKVPFSDVGGNVLRVTAPVLPGTAIGGYYMLFAVNSKGVPAVAKKVILGRAVENRS